MSTSEGTKLQLSSLVHTNIHPPPWLFQEFIRDNSLTMIGAPPHAGKSLLLAAMILSLDSSLPLFGRFAPCGVKKSLALLQDAPDWDYIEQLRKLARGYGLSLEQMELMESEVHLNCGYQITDPKVRKELSKLREDLDFEVLFLDALWTFHGLNENDQSQMQALMKILKALPRELDCAVVFTHHERKISQADAGLNANYRARGSTVIPAAVDFNIPLKRLGKRITLEVPKARGGDEQTLTVEQREVEHPDGIALRLEIVQTERRADAMLKVLGSKSLTRLELQAHYQQVFNLSPPRAANAVSNDLGVLRGQGRVIQERHGIWGLNGVTTTSSHDGSDPVDVELEAKGA